MAHSQDVVGLNPGTLYWMNVRDTSYYINIQKNNENRGGQMGHTKKIYFLKLVPTSVPCLFFNASEVHRSVVVVLVS